MSNGARVRATSILVWWFVAQAAMSGFSFTLARSLRILSPAEAAAEATAGEAVEAEGAAVEAEGAAVEAEAGVTAAEEAEEEAVSSLASDSVRGRAAAPNGGAAGTWFLLAVYVC